MKGHRIPVDPATLDTKTPFNGENLVGRRAGLLTVTSYAGMKKKESRVYYWNALCECGNTRIVNGRDVHYGTVKSCGCARPKRAMATLGEGW